jgi:hypothetical protein
LKKLLEYFKEAREIRKRYANEEYIKKPSPRIRTALKYYIETGDFRIATRIAGIAVDEFLYLAKYEANIPTTH